MFWCQWDEDVDHQMVSQDRHADAGAMSNEPDWQARTGCVSCFSWDCGLNHQRLKLKLRVTEKTFQMLDISVNLLEFLEIKYTVYCNHYFHLLYEK